MSNQPWRAVASAEHPLAGRPVELRALAADPLVLVDGEGADRLRERFQALCRDAGFEPTLGRTLADLDDAMVEIARSNAWTLLRAPNVRDVERLGVIALALTDELPPARLWLAHRTIPAPATRAFVALARRLHRTDALHWPTVRPAQARAESPRRT